MQNVKEFDLKGLAYYFTDPNQFIDSDEKPDLVVYDQIGNFWKANCVKYELVKDETDVILSFKKLFRNSNSFLNSGIKNRIIEAHKQFGREKFLKLKEIPKDCVVFNNYIIYVGNSQNPLKPNIFESYAFEIEKRNFVSSSFDYFITNPIQYDYYPDQKKECPTIDKLFVDWVGEEHKENLYELIAYCMLPDYPIQLAFILNGSGANGKSTFMRIIKKIIGDDNICATDIPTLTDTNFGVAQLYKKLVCFIGETDGHKLERTSIIKRLTGGDEVPAQFKHKANFTFQNYAKIIIATNVIPQTQDKTDGFYRRFLIIDFPNKYDLQKKRDVFSEIPESEFEALANICVSKLSKLLNDGKFTNEPSIEDKAKIYESKSNPLQTFLDNETEITMNPEDYIYSYEFYNKYCDWLKINGYSVNVSSRWIAHEMLDKQITSEQRTKYEDNREVKRYYSYIGIKWKKNQKIEQIIKTDVEYNREEIIEYIRLEAKNKIPDQYTDDDLISIFKKKGIIYEPKSGTYKIQNEKEE